MESIINNELKFDENEKMNFLNWKCDEKYDFRKLKEKSSSISYPNHLDLAINCRNQKMNNINKSIVPLEPKDNKLNIYEEISTKKKYLKLCSKLNTKNIIRNNELKFLPQIEIYFNKNPNKIFELNDYNDFRNELKMTLKEEDFSIIEIKKGSIKVIITLQFLMFSELKNNSNFWLWNSKANNGIDKLDEFHKNICFKIKEILSKFRDQPFISLGSVKPEYVNETVLNLADDDIKSEITKNIQNLVQDDFFKDLNLIEFAKYIDKNDLHQYFTILSNHSKDQEQSQLKIINQLDQFNQVFDIEIEKSFLRSIFEYKIIYIFLSCNDNLDNYNEQKKQCQNKQTSILFHGTTPENVTSIISSQFFESSNRTFGKGVYFSNILDYIWYYYSDEEKGIFSKMTKIPEINEAFTFVASEIYYDKNKREIVFDDSKKEEEVAKYGIRVAFANYDTNILSNSEILTNKKFISKEFLISNKNQFLPLYGIVAKRVEFLVIWRDYNLDINNPNEYSDESFKEMIDFHKNLKKLLSKILNCRIYYVKTTETALKLIDRKKYNKIIIITNGGNNGKEFIIEARKIIGSNVIAAISAYDVYKHIKENQDMKNVLVLNGIEFHQKFFEAVIRNDINLLKNLKNEISKEYLKGTNLQLNDFDDDVFNFPNFKKEGKFSDLDFNNNDMLEDDDLFNKDLDNNKENEKDAVDAEDVVCISCLIV